MNTTLKKITDEAALNAAMQWVDKPVNLSLINNQINGLPIIRSQNQISA